MIASGAFNPSTNPEPSVGRDDALRQPHPQNVAGRLETVPYPTDAPAALDVVPGELIATDHDYTATTPTVWNFTYQVSDPDRARDQTLQLLEHAGFLVTDPSCRTTTGSCQLTKDAWAISLRVTAPDAIRAARLILRSETT
ncbi:hypothetical protein HQQ81_21195 [Microbacteriaceae bacterium VKM Ac-2854]|nr:hypothetical protein [Microbacteriaceae bacterium VKM Ac-2854]